MFITLKRPCFICSDVFYLSYFNLFCVCDLSVLQSFLSKDNIFGSVKYLTLFYSFYRERFNRSSFTEFFTVFCFPQTCEMG